MFGVASESAHRPSQPASDREHVGVQQHQPGGLAPSETPRLLAIAKPALRSGQEPEREAVERVQLRCEIRQTVGLRASRGRRSAPLRALGVRQKCASWCSRRSMRCRAARHRDLRRCRRIAVLDVAHDSDALLEPGLNPRQRRMHVVSLQRIDRPATRLRVDRMRSRAGPVRGPPEALGRDHRSRPGAQPHRPTFVRRTRRLQLEVA